MTIDTKDPVIAAAIKELRAERQAPRTPDQARLDVALEIGRIERERQNAESDMKAGYFAYWALFYYFILVGITVVYGLADKNHLAGNGTYFGLVLFTALATLPALVFAVMAAMQFFLNGPINRGKIRACDKKLAVLRGDPIEKKPEGSLIGATIGVFTVLLLIVGLLFWMVATQHGG
jgi:hypothetical protein